MVGFWPGSNWPLTHPFDLDLFCLTAGNGGLLVEACRCGRAALSCQRNAELACVRPPTPQPPSNPQARPPPPAAGWQIPVDALDDDAAGE